jgi:hypothetical protein
MSGYAIDPPGAFMPGFGSVTDANTA